MSTVEVAQFSDISQSCQSVVQAETPGTDMNSRLPLRGFVSMYSVEQYLKNQIQLTTLSLRRENVACHDLSEHRAR